ncbi:hypothetical protein Q3G72_014059 [Acer saccharum]|nr:hypothetical protein Q3G72_014059 [Acer saccharum]
MVGNLPVAKPKLLAKSQTMTMICDYSYTIESHTRLVKRTKLYYQGCKNKEMKTYWESSFYPKASSVHRKTRKTFRDIFSKSLALLLNSSLRQPIELFQSTETIEPIHLAILTPKSTYRYHFEEGGMNYKGMDDISYRMDASKAKRRETAGGREGLIAPLLLPFGKGRSHPDPVQYRFLSFQSVCALLICSKGLSNIGRLDLVRGLLLKQSNRKWFTCQKYLQIALCGTKDLNETLERSHANEIGKKGGVVNSW